MSEREPGLREQLVRDGYVELTLEPVKVAGNVLFLLAVPAAFVWMFVTEGPVYKVFAVLAAPTVVVLLSINLAEGLFGTGPALRIDRDGLTLRRWGQPLRLPWSDISDIRPYGGRGRSKNTVAAIYLPNWVWADYQAERPAFARLLDRVNLSQRLQIVTPPKMMNRTHREIVDTFDHAYLDELTVPRAPYRLVLDLDLDDQETSPVWVRGGRPVALADLPLSTALAEALKRWHDDGWSMLARETSEPTFDADLQRWIAAGRALTPQVQGELGSTAEVRYVQDL